MLYCCAQLTSILIILLTVRDSHVLFLRFINYGLNKLNKCEVFLEFDRGLTPTASCWNFIEEPIQKLGSFHCKG